jgi:glycosyltransferase involved in cell wall biosynthesis
MQAPRTPEWPTNAAGVQARWLVLESGTPVVALRRGSVPEVVLDGTTGYVRDDPADLPAAIDQAGSIDPAACRRHVEENFAVSVMTTGYERAYARACGMR